MFFTYCNQINRQPQAQARCLLQSAEIPNVPHRICRSSPSSSLDFLPSFHPKPHVKHDVVAHARIFGVRPPLCPSPSDNRALWGTNPDISLLSTTPWPCNLSYNLGDLSYLYCWSQTTTDAVAETMIGELFKDAAYPGSLLPCSPCVFFVNEAYMQNF
jgi:hypothetical protein